MLCSAKIRTNIWQFEILCVYLQCCFSVVAKQRKILGLSNIKPRSNRTHHCFWSVFFV